MKTYVVEATRQITQTTTVTIELPDTQTEPYEILEAVQQQIGRNGDGCKDWVADLRSVEPVRARTVTGYPIVKPKAGTNPQTIHVAELGDLHDGTAMLTMETGKKSKVSSHSLTADVVAYLTWLGVKPRKPFVYVSDLAVITPFSGRYIDIGHGYSEVIGRDVDSSNRNIEEMGIIFNPTAAVVPMPPIPKGTASLLSYPNNGHTYFIAMQERDPVLDEVGDLPKVPTIFACRLIVMPNGGYILAVRDMERSVSYFLRLNNEQAGKLVFKGVNITRNFMYVADSYPANGDVISDTVIRHRFMMANQALNTSMLETRPGNNHFSFKATLTRDAVRWYTDHGFVIGEDYIVIGDPR